jgi:hypothetical protein
MVFLDSSVVIYYVEQPATWGPKAAIQLMTLRASLEQFEACQRWAVGMMLVRKRQTLCVAMAKRALPERKAKQ